MTTLPLDLQGAILEIERLKSEIRRIEESRNKYWDALNRMLPLAPPDEDIDQEEFDRLLAEGEPAEVSLDRILADAETD